MSKGKGQNEEGKSEARNPKDESNPKSEHGHSGFELESSFEFRYSDFPTGGMIWVF